MSAEEEGSISFWDPHFREYLDSVQFGIPINQAVMDYFYLSSFYERDCNNETCAMQNRTRADEETLKYLVSCCLSFFLSMFSGR